MKSEPLRQGMWLGNNDTRRTPLIQRLDFRLGGLANVGGGAWVLGRKSELLFVLELGNDDLSRHLTLGPFVRHHFVVWDRPWGVRVAGCYATKLGNDELGLLYNLLRRMGGLTFGCPVLAPCWVTLSCI